MPLPFLLGIGAAIAGGVGVGAGVHGATKMKEANDTMEAAETIHNRNIARLERENKATSEDMDKLGKLELEIIRSFGTFSDVFEKIHRRPEFKDYSKNGVTLPEYDEEDLKIASNGAEVLLASLGGAGLGVVGGFATAGITTVAIRAFENAPTGTTIASLSGAAFTKGTLSALGGGAIAAGGGGMALGTGTTILGTSALGAGLLVGGIIFNLTGEKLSDKADEAWSQMINASRKIDSICKYLIKLRETSNKYYSILASVNSIYQKHLKRLTDVIITQGKSDWKDFTDEEKMMTENTVLLVGLLYHMGKVEIVLKGEVENDINRINEKGIAEAMKKATDVIVRVKY